PWRSSGTGVDAFGSLRRPAGSDVSSGADDRGAGQRVSIVIDSGRVGAGGPNRSACQTRRRPPPADRTRPLRRRRDRARMVHAAFVCSAHAHARLTRVNLDRAWRAPGVVGVLAGDAVARLCQPYRGVLLHYKGMKTGAMLPLAVERVRYVGEPIVAIAAESRAAADDAATLIDVEYEPLPAVLAPDAAVGAGAPLIHPELGDNLLYETRLAAGDVERAFAGAGRVWTRTFTTGRHTGVPLEPRSLIADYEPA